MNINKNQIRVVLWFFTAILLLFPPRQSFADVTVKIVAVNPSEDENRTVPVKFSLPQGLQREDILETSGLSVDFDVNNSVFYVYGEAELAPKESRTYKVVVRDVWKIPESSFEMLAQALQDKLDAVNDPEKEGAAEILGKRLQENLKSIREQQAALASEVEKRIQMYSVMKDNLQTIKEEIFSFESLIEFGSESIQDTNTVSLIVQAQNSADTSIETPLQYYLPKEIRPEYILNKAGFDLKFDFEKGQYYLSKSVAFGPRETKRFTVEVKNVWNVPEALLNRYVSEAESLIEKVGDSQFVEVGNMLFADIQKTAQDIIESQKQSGTIKDRIAIYRQNLQKTNEIKDDLQKLRSLLSGAKRKPKEYEGKGGVRNVLRQIDYLQTLKRASDALFKDTMKKGTVWRIVMMIVIFIMAITVFFFGVWYTKLKKEEKMKWKRIGK